MCRTTWRGVEARAHARRLDELLLAQAEELRAHQSRHRHPAEAADDATMRMKMPTSSPKILSGSRKRKISSSSTGSWAG